MAIALACSVSGPGFDPGDIFPDNGRGTWPRIENYFFYSSSSITCGLMRRAVKIVGQNIDPYHRRELIPGVVELLVVGVDPEDGLQVSGSIVDILHVNYIFFHHIPYSTN